MPYRYIPALLIFGLFVRAQPPAASSTPLHVLYRLFFREVAALATADDVARSAGTGKDTAINRWHEVALSLTEAEGVALKSGASSCNQLLDQHQRKALPSIEAARARNSSAPYTGTLPAHLVDLEAERTAISNSCIQSLRAALGERAFSTVDVYVRTKFAQKVSMIVPKGAPFEGLPVKRAEVSAQQGGGSQ